MTYKQSSLQLHQITFDIMSIDYDSKVFELLKMSIKFSKLIASVTFPLSFLP